jgi:multimeric flavodoxin WrbA
MMMKVTLIHGQAHRGSTYNVSRKIAGKLPAGIGEIDEFFLPSHAPAYCAGCYRCFREGEEACPQAEKVQAIVRSMEEADVIIIDSPTYCLKMTGQLKTLFDHFAYMWLSHRPREAMFSKVGIVVSTTAGLGARGVTKDMAQQLFWLGIPKVYRYGKRVGAMSWDEVTDKTKAEIEGETSRLASKAAAKAGSSSPGLKLRLLFSIMRMNQKGNKWNATDKDYWTEKGWLDGKNPW